MNESIPIEDGAHWLAKSVVLIVSICPGLNRFDFNERVLLALQYVFASFKSCVGVTSCIFVTS